jgi:hypothetical protein
MALEKVSNRLICRRYTKTDANHHIYSLIAFKTKNPGMTGVFCSKSGQVPKPITWSDLLPFSLEPTDG